MYASQKTQLNLFESLYYLPGWLEAAEATQLFELSTALGWHQNEFSIYGKTMPLPRREVVFGDEPYRYSYSRGRVILTAEPWPTWLWMLRSRVEKATNCSFPLVIGNRYDSGKDHIGWHDDGRPELGPKPAIASVSLGAARTFQVRRKPSFRGERTAIDSYVLGHGDLLIMPPGFQESHLHRVSQSSKAEGSRVNWTFRPWVAED